MYGHPYARNLFTERQSRPSAGFAFCLGALSAALLAVAVASYLHLFTL